MHLDSVDGELVPRSGGTLLHRGYGLTIILSASRLFITVLIRNLIQPDRLIEDATGLDAPLQGVRRVSMYARTGPGPPPEMFQ
jgi:hypothetical protein